MVYLEERIPPTIYSHETVVERYQLLNFIHSSRSNATAEYLINLHDIRQSVRLREKKEACRERELEELKAAEYELRQQKSKDRTQRYNKKLRRKLRRQAVVPAMVQSSDVGNHLDREAMTMLHIRRSQKQRRPKMIVIDKTERRPPSRLLGAEFKKNRSDELVHETLEHYDYLVQELIIDPDDETVCMVMNTYLEDSHYMATLAPIDCEDHHISQSPEFRHRPLLGPEGIVDLLT